MMIDWLRLRVWPVVAILLVVIVLWYGLALLLNAPPVPTGSESLFDRWAMQRPVLPVPHQILGEFWKTTFATEITSKRSLIFHAGVTLSSTALGFLFGTVLGVVLAIGIVQVRTLDRSLMPWLIASQAVPVLAIAPMIIVVLGNIGLTGLIPKSIISMYLSFFPVAIGMVKGLRSPDVLLFDLMRTYSAGQARVLFSLRLPAALPFLFTSLKVAVAAALVGTIVGELPTGATAGLGARLLSGSYYGQTLQIWTALLMSALLGVLLVALVGVAERLARLTRGGRI